MAKFGGSWRTVSGVVGGFSAGAAVSVLLLRQYDTRDTPAVSTTTAAPPVRADQLLCTRATNREFRSPADVESHYNAAIQACRGLVLQTKEEMGIPGVCVAVNVNGETAWTEGFGFSDVENKVPCTPKTVMRVASISKSLTMVALAKLWEDGKIDLDLPVQNYVPKFPQKTFDGEPVEITTRMLTSHLSGIRHWKDDNPTDDNSEFYLNTHFKSVEDALSIFENDELVHKPGTEFLYSSPAWTLVSVVMEKAAGITYKKIMTNLCNELGLTNTRLDENTHIVKNRSRYYTRNEHARLINSPGVDNSCKWAGGGFQSTVGDLVKFADAMLYCYQGGLSGYLKKDTIDAMWTISPKTMEMPVGVAPFTGYGLGWFVVPAIALHGGLKPQTLTFSHSGGAVGASSFLLIQPQNSNDSKVPCGVTVAITVNLQGVGLSKLAHEIAHNFLSTKTSES